MWNTFPECDHPNSNEFRQKKIQNLQKQTRPGRARAARTRRKLGRLAVCSGGSFAVTLNRIKIVGAGSGAGEM